MSATTASSTETMAVKAFAEAYRAAYAAGPITYEVEPDTCCPCCGGDVEPYERDPDELPETRTEFSPFYDALMIAWPHLNAMAWAERHAGVVLTPRGRNLLDRCEAVGHAPLGLTHEETCERMLMTMQAIADLLGADLSAAARAFSSAQVRARLDGARQRR